MAGNSWDREIINTRERPLSSDINALQSQLDRTLRDVLMKMFVGRASATSDISDTPNSGFIGDSLKCRPSNPVGNSLKVAAGLGFMYSPGDTPAAIGGLSGLDDLSFYKPLPLLADANLVGLPAGPGAGQDR